MITDYDSNFIVYDVVNTFELVLKYKVQIDRAGIMCGAHPDMNDENVLITPWWYNYYQNYTTDLIVYNIKN